MGSVLRFLGKFQEAYDLTKKSIEIHKNVFQGDHPTISNSLVSLSAITLCLERCEEALDYAKQSHEMNLRMHEKDHLKIARSLIITDLF